MADYELDYFGSGKKRKRIWHEIPRRSIEFWVSIGVIFASALFFFNSVWKPTTEAARRTTCRGNLKNIYRAITMYTDDNGGTLPLSSWEKMENWIALSPYLEKRPKQSIASIITCPSDSREKVMGEQQMWHSYQINNFLNGGLLSNVCEKPLAWDINGGIGDKKYTNHEEGGNVLLGDGSCRFLPFNKWYSYNMPRESK